VTKEQTLKIGILGAGSIGATLTRRLSAGDHQVKVANSRGPETIPADLLASGAQAVHASQVAADIDVLIVSVPLSRVPDIKPLLADLPEHAVIIDTSNYYPMRDGHIEALDAGQVESLWVAEQYGRPIVKGWNAITSPSFDTKNSAAGDPGRLAIPVAADRDADRALGMALVEQTGFDAVDVGTLAESWRQQPGTPAYCTDLTRDELPAALAKANAGRSPKRRDLAMTVITELTTNPLGDLGDDFFVRVNRLIYN
jgi:predicted dinucleotide-binding enzyme